MPALTVSGEITAITPVAATARLVTKYPGNAQRVIRELTARSVTSRVLLTVLVNVIRDLDNVPNARRGITV